MHIKLEKAFLLFLYTKSRIKKGFSIKKFSCCFFNLILNREFTLLSSLFIKNSLFLYKTIHSKLLIYKVYLNIISLHWGRTDMNLSYLKQACIQPLQQQFYFVRVKVRHNNIINGWIKVARHITP